MTESVLATSLTVLVLVVWETREPLAHVTWRLPETLAQGPDLVRSFFAREAHTQETLEVNVCIGFCKEAYRARSVYTE